MTNTITVTYGRKQPGPQEYSSESVTVAMTQDLGAASEDGEIRTAIESLFQMLKQEVDRRLPAPPAPLPPRPQLPPPSGGAAPAALGGRLRPYANGGNGRHASPKQVQYLLSLANQRGVGFEALADFLQGITGKRDPYTLGPDEASRVIDSLKA